MMGAPSNYYVDPATASDGGDGSSGSPWTRADGAAIQYALDNITRDSTNGDRINVKSGTAHTTGLSSLSLATYGTPTAAAPLWIQGYTSTAGDGGRGEFDSGASSIFAAYNSYLHFHDMSPSSTATDALNVNQYATVINCVCGCNVRLNGSGCAAIGNTVNGRIYAVSTSRVIANKITTASYGILLNGANSVAALNEITCTTGATYGITISGHACTVVNNSLYASATVARGIHINDASYQCAVVNNLVEGFTTALENETNANTAGFWCNSVFDETTMEDFAADALYDTVTHQNDSLASSPFANAAGGDFTPQDTGTVLDGFGPVATNQGAVSATGGGGGGGDESDAWNRGRINGLREAGKIQ